MCIQADILPSGPGHSADQGGPQAVESPVDNPGKRVAHALESKSRLSGQGIPGLLGPWTILSALQTPSRAEASSRL